MAVHAFSTMHYSVSDARVACGINRSTTADDAELWFSDTNRAYSARVTREDLMQLREMVTRAIDEWKDAEQ